MANVDSNLITNERATPAVQNDAALMGGRVRSAKGYVELATGDLDATDTFMLANIPTNARIEGIWLKNTDMDSDATETLEFDVGVYTTAATPVIKDATAFYDGSADNDGGFENANSVWVDVFRAAPVASPDTDSDKLWVYATDSADPGGKYAIGVVCQGAAATAVAGVLYFKIHYTVD